jgi:hypothetical protein
MSRDLHSTLVATAAATALLLAAGCTPSARSAGTPAAPSTVATAPAPPPPPKPFRLSHRDLVRALPRLSTLTAWRQPVECLRRDAACGRLRTPHGVGHGVYLQASGTDDGLANEMLSINVIAWPSVASAHARASKARQVSQAYEGSFDQPLKRLPSGSYRLGEVGHGHVRSLTIGSWKGFERDSAFRYTVAGRSSKPVRQMYVAVQRRRYCVEIAVSRWADRPPELQAGPSLRALLEPLLDRLDAA